MKIWRRLSAMLTKGCLGVYLLQMPQLDLFVCGISLTSGQLFNELFHDWPQLEECIYCISCYSPVIHQSNVESRLYLYR